MISRFALRDFKGHRDTQLALGRFTMLVGDNASGKTSVLDALALQGRFGTDPVAAFGEALLPEDLLRRGSKGPITLMAEGVTDRVDWSNTYELDVSKKDSANSNASWRLTLTQRRGEGTFKEIALGTTPPGWTQLTTPLGTAELYRLHAEQIAAAAYSDEPEIGIAADGTNTAVALAAMKLGNDEVFQRVEDSLRELIPAVERVRIRPATVHRSGPVPSSVRGSKLYFDFRGAPGVPAHGASHGTLIVLALLAILHGERRPNLILLDDFDHALHPRAQADLVRMIKKLLTLEQFRDVQVVATTHSPYALDEIDPSDVYAFALRDDGTVASRRLSEHPDADRTRGTLKAGQLWSLDPERDWVLRG